MQADNPSKAFKRIRDAHPTVEEMGRALEYAGRVLGGLVPDGITYGSRDDKEYFTPGAKGTINAFSLPQWTKEPPTVPGWYWYRYPCCETRIVWLERDRDTGRVDPAVEPCLLHGSEWCGPLTPPC